MLTLCEAHVFLPSLPRLSICDIWEKVCFSFNSEITFMWEHWWPSHFSWKSLNTYQFIPSRENHVTVSYVYTRKQCVVYPLGYPCSSELCILVCFSQADLHFNIIYIPSPDFMSSYISRNINLKPYLSCIANAAVCSNNTDPLVSSLISDQRPQLRSSRPRASVTTWEWQRVSHSSGAWAKLSVTAAKQPSNLSWMCN